MATYEITVPGQGTFEVSGDGSPEQVVGKFQFERALADEGIDGAKADFIRSLHGQESSGGTNNKTSNRGAVGPMQVLPGTFKEVADKGWDINDTYFNNRAGARYASKRFDEAKGDVKLAAAGYYGGPGGQRAAARGQAVQDPVNKGDAPNTLQYGDQVSRRFEKARAAQAAAQTAAPKDEAPPYRVDVSLGLDQKDTYPDESTRGVKPPAPPRTPLQATGDVAGMVWDAAKGAYKWLDEKTQESNRNVQGVIENPVQTAKEVWRNKNALAVGMADPINTVGAYTAYPVMDAYKGVPKGTTHAEQVAEANRVFQEGTDPNSTMGQTLREAGGFGGTSLLTAGAGGVAAGPIRAALGGGRIAGAAAPVLGDALAGGAYGAAEADQRGEDPLRAFGTNALGAAGGSLFSRAVGAGNRVLSRPNSPEAERLLSRGFELTPGQRSPNGIMAAAERRAASNPLTRPSVVARQNETVDAVIDARIDHVTRNLGVTRNGTGKAAVRDMTEQVNSPQVYDRIVNDTFALPSTVRNAVNGARNRAVQLGGSREREMNRLLDEVLDTASHGAVRPTPGTWYRYNGRAMADADVRLGEMIKQAGAKTQEGRVLKRLQEDLRSVTRGNTPEARQLLDEVRAARRELFGLEKGTKGKTATGESVDAGLRKNKQPGEPDLAAVDSQVRGQGGGGAAQVLLGLSNPKAAAANLAFGLGGYTKTGIRAINAASRGAQRLRGIYGNVPPYLRPGPYTTNAAREQGAPLVDEWLRQQNQQYE